MKNINWKYVFDKVGTVIVDRRFWLKFVCPTIIALGIFPVVTEANAEAMSDQAVALSNLFVAVVVPTLSAWLLSVDWTKRAPSGLRFKETTSDVDEFVSKMLDSIENTK